jgi:hypothetical protein
MIDYKNCTGHLEDLGIVKLEGNIIPVRNADMWSINGDRTNSISSLGALPEDVEKEHSLPKK